MEEKKARHKQNMYSIVEMLRNMPGVLEVRTEPGDIQDNYRLRVWIDFEDAELNEDIYMELL